MTSTNITSPCSRLNNDVLREIFVRCAEPFYVHQRRWWSYPQFRVSRVCSSWRDVALLTPQLWNDICIFELTEAKLSIAREYLSRAGSLPISILLSKEVDGWRSLPLLAEFLSSYRLRKLRAIGRGMTFIYLILPDLPQWSVSALEQVWFPFNFEHHNGLSMDLNDIRYPKLTVIRGRWKGGSNILRVFDGSNVVMTVIETWALLRRCPFLLKGRFVLKQDRSSPGPVSVPGILLQHLGTLELESEETDDVNVMPFSTFIEALALPNLEKLDVMHPTRRVAWSATTFRLFAQRSNHFPNLRQFALRGPTSDVDVGPLLALMPSITSIDLCSHDYPSRPQAVFDHLALDGLASGSLAPKLQSLSVGYLSDVKGFMNMVESRMKNAQMSSDGVLAPFTFVSFQELQGHVSDQVHWGVQIIRY